MIRKQSVSHARQRRALPSNAAHRHPLTLAKTPEKGREKIASALLPTAFISSPRSSLLLTSFYMLSGRAGAEARRRDIPSLHRARRYQKGAASHPGPGAGTRAPFGRDNAISGACISNRRLMRCQLLPTTLTFLACCLRPKHMSTNVNTQPRPSSYRAKIMRKVCGCRPEPTEWMPDETRYVPCR